nr:acetyl-CoA carboxylase carboxyltransferase beta subunit [Thismia panamensis]
MLYVTIHFFFSLSQIEEDQSSLEELFHEYEFEKEIDEDSDEFFFQIFEEAEEDFFFIFFFLFKNSELEILFLLREIISQIEKITEEIPGVAPGKFQIWINSYNLDGKKRLSELELEILEKKKKKEQEYLAITENIIYNYISSSDRIELLIDIGTWNPLDELLITVPSIFETKKKIKKNDKKKIKNNEKKVLDNLKKIKYELLLTYKERFPENDLEKELDEMRCEYEYIELEILKKWIDVEKEKRYQEVGSFMGYYREPCVESFLQEKHLNYPDKIYKQELKKGKKTISVNTEEYLNVWRSNPVQARLILFLEESLISIEANLKESKDKGIFAFYATLDEKKKIKSESKYEKYYDTKQKKTGLAEAIQTGIATINGVTTAIGIMDYHFIGGSLGSAVGEKITRLIEYAYDQNLPTIVICASSGARMQEGIMALMQMAKVACALYELKKKKKRKTLFITIHTSPTTGGVSASFGMLGDIIIAEPNIYVAFAGKRVIEELLKKDIPSGFQVSDYWYKKGAFDLLLPNYYLRDIIIDIFNFHSFPKKKIKKNYI